MDRSAFDRILALSSTAAEVEESVQYLAAHFAEFLRQGESVLVCFPRDGEASLGSELEKAILRCGCVPVYWEKDLRWKELLRLAFITHASTIVAPPLVVLGLAKIALVRGVPLNFFNVVTAGYPCLDWMIDGIENLLDCRMWGILGPGTEGIVSGFSCQCGRGVHIRKEKYHVAAFDERGGLLPDGETGRIKISSNAEPATLFDTNAYGSVMKEKCPCGSSEPKLIGIDDGHRYTTSLFKVAEELLYWNSILDCRFTNTECGLEMEIICFPGEKMPHFPSCAKLIVRPWNPEEDIPLSLNTEWKYL